MVAYGRVVLFAVSGDVSTVKSLLFNFPGYICLILLLACFLAEGHEPPFPAPCDQLGQTTYRERCARFLADRETVGCHTFRNATTVASYEELKAGLEQEKQGNGLILLVAGDINIVELKYPMIARGTVAIVGDPDKLPKISHIGLGVFFSGIHARNAETPAALFCWGIDWVLDAQKEIVRVSPHFGTVHITHSIFRINRDSTAPLSVVAHQYLRITMSDSVGQVKNALLVAHNQFHGVPAAFLDGFSSEDIFIGCDRVLYLDVVTDTCYEPGEVIIRDNTWHGHDPYPESVNYAAIRLDNIARATISGNRAVDDNALLSVHMNFNYPLDNDETPFFDNLNLQLVNNTALPGMKATHRQFCFDSRSNDTGYPLAGVVNMTCNPYFDVIEAGSFARTAQQPLAITRGYYSCTGFTEGEGYAGYSENNIQCEAIPVNPENEGDMGEVDDLDSCGGSGKYFISTYSLGVSTATLAAVSWELFWSLVYQHSSGKTQWVVNALALFIPGCFRRASKLPLEKALTP